MDTLLVNYNAREKRFAFLRNNRVEQIMFDRPEHRSLVGNIYFGTVTKVLPGMNAAFIDIGGEKNAYLHRDVLPSYVQSPERQKNITSFVHQGEKMLVQVNKDSTGTKGPRVTALLELQGNHLVYMPQGRYVAVSKKIAEESKKEALRQIGNKIKIEEEGLIIRTSGIYSSEEELQAELEDLRIRYQELHKKTLGLKKPGLLFQQDTFIEMVMNQVARMRGGEVIVDDIAVKKTLEQVNDKVKTTFYNGKENIFSANKVEHEIDKALKRIVWLDHGAYLIFDETEALTIIDVNTGKFSGKTDYQDTVFKTNQLAAKEIVRQLKLRDIGGIILIDFIDMKRDDDKQSILETVETELKKDEKRTKIIGYTPLGILQLTRKKTKVALSEALQVKCPACEGTGRILSAETMAFRLERELLEHRHAEYEAILIETTIEVKEVLLGPNEAHREALEDLLHLKLYFSIQSSIPHYYVLKQFGDEEVLSQKE